MAAVSIMIAESWCNSAVDREVGKSDHHAIKQTTRTENNGMIGGIFDLIYILIIFQFPNPFKQIKMFS